MAISYLPLAEPFAKEAAPRSARPSGKVLVLLCLLVGFSCALVWNTLGRQDSEKASAELAALQSVQMAKGLKGQASPMLPASKARMLPAKAWKSISAEMQSAGMAAANAAAAKLQSPSLTGRKLPAQFYKTAMSLAMKTGLRDGCRGDLVCTRAVGLFFSTQTGKTEEIADMIAAETGLAPKDIGDASPEDLKGYDGLIVGTPTWNTGADEQRSGTAWDDYLEQIRALDLGGKPVAVFGVGDSYGYGDNFCDAIEELHSTFQAAGAKMLGYVANKGYSHAESKSVTNDKWLGLATDQDNEDDQSPTRVKNWVAQIKGEGMPVV
jgi:flavodoxin I